MKVIIAGSRTITPSVTQFANIIKESKFNIKLLVSGGASGVDSSAEFYCNLHGIPSTERDFHVPKWVWDYLGRKAGPLRNKEMAKFADALILIWDGKSKGSASMKFEMEKLNKPIYEVILTDN